MVSMKQNSIILLMKPMKYQYVSDVEVKLEEYYFHFSSFGMTEKEAIDRLCYSLRISRNVLLMQKNRIRRAEYIIL